MRSWRAWMSAVVTGCLLMVMAAPSAGAQEGEIVMAATSEEPVGWEVLPNGLIMVQYDRTGDDVPDYFTLHQITWSGLTCLTPADITAQAQADGDWIFVVHEEDFIRYVYLAKATPLFFADDPQQDGRWTAVPVQSHSQTPAVHVLPCSACMR